MSLIEAGQIGIDKAKWVSGFKITVKGENLKPKRKALNSTARHEALHVVAAINNGTSVNKVTIVPGVGYSGLTELNRPDPIAALAPHANGADGTSWDVYIASLMGHSPETSGAAARSIIASHEDEVEAVAVALEDEKTLNSSGVTKAISEYKKSEFETASIDIKSPEGESVWLSGVEVRDNIVMLPNIWYDVLKSYKN